MNKKFIGDEGEKLAVNFLESKGVIVLERNFTAHGGEIDVIFKDEGYLVFGEVKYRVNTRFGDPFDAVNYSKIKRLIKTSKYYLYKNHYPDNTPVRFDVIGILDGKIQWIKDAFSE